MRTSIRREKFALFSWPRAVAIAGLLLLFSAWWGTARAVDGGVRDGSVGDVSDDDGGSPTRDGGMSAQDGNIAAQPAAALPTSSGKNPWTKNALKVWGFNDALRKNNRESYFGRYFYARKDQVLTSARLTLNLDDEPPIKLPADIRALEISLNDQVVATIDRKTLLVGSRHLVIDFDPHLLSEVNEFVFHFLTYSKSPCQAIVEPGAWHIIKDGMVETLAAQLPLPNNLGALPIPFFDQRTDREPTVQFVFLEPPTPATLRAASLVASYFGILTGSAGARFPTMIGRLPRGHAVVITTASGRHDALNLPAVNGPTVSMIDHPSATNYKLLLVQGRDADELYAAAQNLVAATWGSGGFEGASIQFDVANDVVGRVPRELPRGFVTERETTFANMISGESLTHRGYAGGTLQLEFRITPETLMKPAQYLVMDIEYLQRIPAPYTPPKLDVEFNGIHVKTLPMHEGGIDAQPHTEHLILPRDQLRGSNRLQFHISAVQHRPLCNSASQRLIETTISGKSVLKLVGENELLYLPDVEAFVYDGLPFTRMPDASSTVVVLSNPPAPQEISTALSVISNLAGATGRPTSGIEFMFDNMLDEASLRSRDLIVVGVVPTSALLARWADMLPVDATLGTLHVHVPTGGGLVRNYLRGNIVDSQRELAARFLNESLHPGIVMGMESPFSIGRSVIFIAANKVEELPTIIDLQGYTEARLAEGGDLLILDGEKRAIFHLGSSYSDGSIGRYAQLRSLFGEYWIALFPLMLGAVLLSSLVLQRSLSRRARERLSTGEKH